MKIFFPPRQHRLAFLELLKVFNKTPVFLIIFDLFLFLEFQNGNSNMSVSLQLYSFINFSKQREFGRDNHLRTSRSVREK